VPVAFSSTNEADNGPVLRCTKQNDCSGKQHICRHDYHHVLGYDTTSCCTYARVGTEALSVSYRFKFDPIHTNEPTTSLLVYLSRHEVERARRPATSGCRTSQLGLRRRAYIRHAVRRRWKWMHGRQPATAARKTMTRTDHPSSRSR
jgi:hypothetical protein